MARFRSILGAIIGLCVGIVGPTYYLNNYTERYHPTIKDDLQSYGLVTHYGDFMTLNGVPNDQVYSIEGIEGNNTFEIIDGKLSCLNHDYVETPNDPDSLKNILNANGEIVGEVYLTNKSEVAGEEITINLLNEVEQERRISKNVKKVNIVGNSENLEFYTLCIDSRETPIDIVFDNIQAKTNTITPFLFSVYPVKVNLEIIGTCSIKGGDNVYQEEDAEALYNQITKDALLTPLGWFGASVMDVMSKGYDVFEGNKTFVESLSGVLSNQLVFVENGWENFEDFWYGKDGSDGLDGASAILLNGSLCVYGNDENASLSLSGGRGANGSNGTDSWSLTEANPGGNGGNGGSALICNQFISSLSNISYISGEGGNGGKGGVNMKGETGRTGKEGKANEKTQINDFNIFVNE